MSIYPATPFGLPDNAPELARRFGMIMAGLGAVIARRFLKMPHLMRFTVQLYSYLSRAVRRFHRALNGTGNPRARRARGDRADGARVRPLALPSGRGWIVRELGWEAAAFMSQLQALLSEAEARAVVDRLPGVGRVLRPICRMLGVTAAVVPKVLAPSVPAVVTEQRLEPGGLPGVAGECEVIATSL